MTDIQYIPKTENLQTAIKKLRLRFPVKEISEKTGFNKGSVSSYVNGKIPPSIPFMEKLSQAYGIEISELLDTVIKDTSENETTGFYYPEVSASAGLESQMQNDELKKIPVTIPGWDNEISFINVFGDSMYPKYNAGEIIGVKYIDFEYLNYGSAYVIVFKNGDTYIKIIQPGSDKQHLILESINEFYKPKEYHIDFLKTFYSIKGVIKKEMM